MELVQPLDIIWPSGFQIFALPLTLPMSSLENLLGFTEASQRKYSSSLSFSDHREPETYRQETRPGSQRRLGHPIKTPTLSPAPQREHESFELL